MKDEGPRIKSQYISLPHFALGKNFLLLALSSQTPGREATLEQKVTASLSCKDLRL